MVVKFNDQGRNWTFKNVVKIEMDTKELIIGYYDDQNEYHEEFGEIPTGEIIISNK